VVPIDLSPGSLFASQFRIVRPLAKGGMGAVYVVEQVATGRERALKLMHPMLVSDAKSIERFQREAQVASRIESDHVVEVIAAGVEPQGPTPWLCMELLKGETLADRIEKRGVPGREEIVEIVKQLAHALGAAHRAGIVHRDLKPENIFLAESRRDGVPFTLKVLDFGVATLTNEMQGPKTTQGVGSPLWMAPEQTNVGKVVLATDVWAIGLIVFFLVTGQSYWRTAKTPGSTITALLVEIMVEALVPASERAREVAPGLTLPAGFDAWFARCVTRDTAARFQDATAAMTPLFGLLANAGQTLPEAFLATVAMPSTGSGTQPGALSHGSGPQPPTPAASFGSHALAATHPGPQLASGAQGVTQPQQPGPQYASGPQGVAQAPGQGPGAYAPSAQTVSSSLPSARPRPVWPWVLLGALGLGGLCAVGVTYQLVRGTEEIVREIADSQPSLEGHFVDPETGATVDLGPDGVRVSGPRASATGPSGSTAEAEAGAEAEAEAGAEAEAEAEPDTEAEAEAEAGAEAEAEAEPDTEAEAEAGAEAEAEAEHGASSGSDPDTDEAPARAGLSERLGRARDERRGRRGALLGALAGANAASPEQHRAFRGRVIDPCWRGTYEGEMPPARARYVVHVSGSSIRVDAPRDTSAQQAFIRCVVSRSTGAADGDYLYMLP